MLLSAANALVPACGCSGWWHWAKALTPSLTLMRNFCDTSNQQQSESLVNRFSLGQQYRFWKTDINAAVHAAQDSANSSTVSLDGASVYQRGQKGCAAVMSLATVRQLVSACEVLSDELRRGSSEVASQCACYSAWLPPCLVAPLLSWLLLCSLGCYSALLAANLHGW